MVWEGQEEAQDGTAAPALTPAQLQVRQMVLDSVTSPHSPHNYVKALDLLFVLAAGRPLTRALLMEYRSGMDVLAPSTVNVRLSAIRKLVTEARRNGMLSAEEAANLTDIPNVRQQGIRMGNWLTKEQARELLAVPIAPPSRASATTRCCPFSSVAPCGEGSWHHSPWRTSRCERTAGSSQTSAARVAESARWPSPCG